MTRLEQCERLVPGEGRTESLNMSYSRMWADDDGGYLDRDEALSAATLDLAEAEQRGYRRGVEDATKPGLDFFAEKHLKNFVHLTGCGDSCCIVAKTRGMQTNGGCQCLKQIPDRDFRQLVMRVFLVLEIRQRLEALKNG